MGIKRIVDVSFWIDDKVIEMFSPEDKLFMLYLLTNPHSTQLGVYSVSIKVIAFEIGYSADAIRVLIDRFENKYKMIKFSPKTNEFAIKNFLRHSIIKGGKPVEDLLKKEIKEVKNKKLLNYIYDEINDDENLNATVKNILPLLFNDNDNDNDNEVSCDDSHNESCSESSKVEDAHKKTPKHIKQKYGEYQNVLLSNEQLEKLQHEFSADWKGRIERVSEYCASTGKTYKDYLATIRSWAKNEKKGSDVVGKFGNAIKFDIPKSNRETSRTENLDNEIKELGLL